MFEPLLRRLKGGFTNVNCKLCSRIQPGALNLQSGFEQRAYQAKLKQILATDHATFAIDVTFCEEDTQLDSEMMMLQN